LWVHTFSANQLKGNNFNLLNKIVVTQEAICDDHSFVLLKS